MSRVARLVYINLLQYQELIFAFSPLDPKTMYYKVVYDEDGDAEDLFASGVKEILVE